MNKRKIFVTAVLGLAAGNCVHLMAMANHQVVAVGWGVQALMCPASSIMVGTL